MGKSRGMETKMKVSLQIYEKKMCKLHKENDGKGKKLYIIA